MLRNNNVKVGFKPLNVLRARFPWAKDPTPQSRDVAYKNRLGLTVISFIMDKQIEPWQRD